MLQSPRMGIRSPPISRVVLPESAGQSIGGAPYARFTAGRELLLATSGANEDLSFELLRYVPCRSDVSGPSLAEFLGAIRPGERITIDRSTDDQVTITADQQTGGGTPTPPADPHTRYFGWSADREIESGDLLTANTSDDR